MRVRTILQEKATGRTTTVIASQALVEDVAQVLAEKHIGALVVSDDGETILGMISERDIVREIARLGPAALKLPIPDVMTRKVITASLDDDATVVLEKMSLGRFRHMPVLEEGKIAGLISIGDVVKARLSQLDLEKRSLEGMIMGF